MTFSNEHIGSGADGAIHNLFAEFPTWMEHADIDSSISEIDAGVQAIKEPPVAKVLFPVTELGGDIEDYRKFYVEFDSEATAEDIFEAVRIVSGAIKKFRYSN